MLKPNSTFDIGFDSNLIDRTDLKRILVYLRVILTFRISIKYRGKASTLVQETEQLPYFAK